MKRTGLIALILAASAVLASCGGSGKGSKAEQDMHPVIENILGRKSVRSYTERPVEQEKVELMLRAGMAAPSGRDIRPWELVVVNERAKLNEMAEGLPYASMLKSAPMAIIVCGDTAASSLWYQDCSAVTQNILLTAEALGLGAVWTAGYPYEERMNAIISILGLPENVLPLCVVPVGYPKGEHSPKQKFDESKVHYNTW